MNRQKKDKRFFSNEAGNIAFYVAFVIPISLVFLIIVIDISQWQFLREEAQRDADRTALELSNFLPNEELVASVSQQKINNYNSASTNLKISSINNNTPLGSSFSADSISIEITGKHESVTDSLLSAATGNQVVLNVSQSATARVVPYDVMLVFSDAVSLRPQAFTLYGSPQEYPASEYFNLIALPTISVSPPPTPPRGWPNWWDPAVFNGSDYKRWATQSCFNPMTLPLKHSLLMMIDQLGGSTRNRLGVYATPGDANLGVGFSVIKEFSFLDNANNNTRWSTYFEPDVPNSDEACLLYSHAEIGMQNYAIPEISSFVAQRSGCQNVILRNPFSSPNGHYPNPLNSSLSPCFTQVGGPMLREAVYYRAVRMHPHQANAGNISNAISSSLSRIVEEEKVDPQGNITSRRGLSSKANKLLVVISDAIPILNEQSIQDVVRFVDSEVNFKFYFFVYNHQALDVNTRNINQAIVQSYNALGKNRFIARVVDEGTILNEIKALLLNEKRVVISS